MASQYLYDDIGSFFDSFMWTGDKAYAQTPVKPWFGWIYISEFNGFNVQDYTNLYPDNIQNLKYKIGYTLNIAQRTEALNVSTNTDDAIQDSSTIVYTWSVPRPFTFETKVKRFLKAFIHADALLETTQGKTEIVHGLTLGPLVNVIQLCILEQCLEHGYIKGDNSVLKNKIMSCMRSPPDIIKDNNHKYYGKKLSKNVSYTMDMKKVIDGLDVETYPSNYVSNYVSMNDPPTFVQYVFDIQLDNGEDQRKDNPKLKDATNITSEMIITEPDNSGIDHPFHVGAGVFTKYKGKYSPCKIIGYGTGIHKGQYVIEWIESNLSNSQLTFPTDSNGKYKIWMTVDGERPRHEYRQPDELEPWNRIRTKQQNPNKKIWSTHVVRLGRDVISSKKKAISSKKKKVISSKKKRVSERDNGEDDGDFFFELGELEGPITLVRLKEIAGHLFKIEDEKELKEKVRELAGGNTGHRKPWRVAILKSLNI